MRCVKTGIMFQVPEFREDTFHGDMFYCTELALYLIRGVARDTSDITPHLVLSPFGDAYEIDKIDPKFEADFRRINGDQLKLEVNLVCVLIDDTRFFI